MPNLNHFQTFRGALSHGEDQWDLTFKARVGPRGGLHLKIPDLPLDEHTAKIRRRWDKEGETLTYYRLTGLSRSGTRFETDRLCFVGTGHTSDAQGTTLHFKAEATSARFITPHAVVGPPVVRQMLRGLRGFRSVRASTPLGEVIMAGQRELKDGEHLSGYLLVKADQVPKDPVAWREAVDKLMWRVCVAMSFAGARQIKAPFTESWSGAEWHLETSSQGASYEVGQPVIHFLNQGPFFEAVAKACFAPNVDFEKITYAMEWFAMPATHTEVRLITAMTALEHLVDANLTDDEASYLPRARFAKLASAMRKTLSDGEATPREEAFRTALPGKMADLNRRTLREKTEHLIHRWNSPTQDLPDDGLEAAIRARNRIVHRGYYYDPTVAIEEHDLWDHVLLVRELLARLLLRALGYHGQYLRYRGGYNIAQLPPPSEGTGADADSRPAPNHGAGRRPRNAMAAPPETSCETEETS